MKPRSHRALGLSLALVTTLGAGLVSLAGPLNPPAGPIVSTNKTLQEVEPRIAINATNTPGDANSVFKITQRGSYYLTGNIAGVAARHGIEIATDGVTLDLNGFDVIGVAGSLDGVNASVALLRNIVVANGSVRNWGGDGVDLTLGQNGRVEGVHANGNVGSGISVGQFFAISNCVASSNSIHGIQATGGCTISNCAAFFNTFNGFSFGVGCTVSSCSATSNSDNGFSTNGGSTISHCAANLNTNDGFNAGGGTAISNCAAFMNTGIGMDVVASSVTDCIVRQNTLDGIQCNGESLIRGNTCATNGNGAGNGAGIHVIGPGTDCRIEGNNCTGNDRGIDVDNAGHIIYRNTCSGNTTNWDVAAGNVCLVVSAVAGGAILGNSGGASPGASDPIANYSY